MGIKTQKLSESMEDYLETILELESQYKVARVKDIADKMGVLSGSVTSALKQLADKALIDYKPYSYITLTTKGKTIASKVSKKHQIISGFLQNVLLIEPEDAEANACRMEHAMDDLAIERLVQFIEYIDYCPRAGEDWLQAFVQYYSKKEHDTTTCTDCLDDCVDRFKKELTQG
jgi:DtxR family Mn-dependent transcriptional regulator